KQSVLDLMGRVSVLCNDAELFEEDGAWKVQGDPTEGALYPFATKLGMHRQTEQAASPRIDAIPFESEHKFMATLHKSADGKELPLRRGAPGGAPDAWHPRAPRRGRGAPFRPPLLQGPPRQAGGRGGGGAAPRMPGDPRR